MDNTLRHVNRHPLFFMVTLSLQMFTLLVIFTKLWMFRPSSHKHFPNLVYLCAAVLEERVHGSACVSCQDSAAIWARLKQCFAYKARILGNPKLLATLLAGAITHILQ